MYINQDLGRPEIHHDSNGNVDVQLLMTSDNIWMTQKAMSSCLELQLAQ